MCLHIFLRRCYSPAYALCTACTPRLLDLPPARKVIAYILYRQVKRNFPWYNFTSSKLRHRNRIQWVGDGVFKFFSQWRCSETTWCSSCEGKATQHVRKSSIFYVCTVNQKLTIYSKSEYFVSCCDFMEKHYFMFLSTVNFRKKSEKVAKLIWETIIFRKYFIDFFLKNINLFCSLWNVDRACEIVQTPLSSCRLFF